MPRTDTRDHPTPGPTGPEPSSIDTTKRQAPGPDTCRLHPQKKSPKPGFCAYGRRVA